MEMKDEYERNYGVLRHGDVAGGDDVAAGW